MDINDLYVNDLADVVRLVMNSDVIEKYSYSLLKQINEKNIETFTDPNWFYLVLRDGSVRGDKNPNVVWESLSRMKFDGLRGISDNILISRAWFDVRNIMLVMPADKVLEMNKINKIQYFNPDQLVNNNFEIIKRVMDNERGDDKYNITSTITKIFQNLSSIGNQNVIGSKKKSRIYGTWTRNPSAKYVRDIIHMMDIPSFYYGVGDYIYDMIQKDNIVINNIDDLSRMVGNFINSKREEYTKEEYGKRGRLSKVDSFK